MARNLRRAVPLPRLSARQMYIKFLLALLVYSMMALPGERDKPRRIAGKIEIFCNTLPGSHIGPPS